MIENEQRAYSVLNIRKWVICCTQTSASAHITAVASSLFVPVHTNFFCQNDLGLWGLTRIKSVECNSIEIHSCIFRV